MKPLKSPLHIKLLLEAYCTPKYVPEPHHASFIKELFDANLVRRSDGLSDDCAWNGEIKATPLGNAMVEALINTEIPRVAYVGRDGKILKYADE